jgi:hypothetical protein
VIYLAAVYALTLAMGGLLVRGLLGERGRAEAAWRDERQALLQRIQAPDSEVIRYFYDQGEQHNPPALRTDDEPGADEQWELARVTKDDLAQALEEQLSRD